MSKRTSVGLASIFFDKESTLITWNKTLLKYFRVTQPTWASVENNFKLKLAESFFCLVWFVPCNDVQLSENDRRDHKKFRSDAAGILF